MTNPHNKVVSKILAIYLDIELDKELLDSGNSEFFRFLIVAGFSVKDREEIIKVARAKANRLHKSAEPLGDRAMHWFDDLVKNSD